MNPKIWQNLLFLFTFGVLLGYLGLYIWSDIILQQGWSFMQNALYIELVLSLGIGIIVMGIIRATSPRTFSFGKALRIMGTIIAFVFVVDVITHNALQGSWWYGALFGIPLVLGIMTFSEYEKFNRKQMAGMVLCLLGAVLFIPVPYLGDRQYIRENYVVTKNYDWQILNGSVNPNASRILALVENGTFMPDLNWTWKYYNTNYTQLNTTIFQPEIQHTTLCRDVPLHIGRNDAGHFLYNCTVVNFSQPIYVNYWWHVNYWEDFVVTPNNLESKIFMINSTWWNLSKGLFYQYIYLNASMFPMPLEYATRNITISSGYLVSQYFDWSDFPCIPLEQHQWWILDMQCNVMLIVRERMGQVCTLSEETMVI